ncbi:DUF883 family protein [Caenimonas aquaedulcis]|uniref:DUF883 family protein n=1 Tax=Caenimonas aquaedulcis TaxID=2793270 RepID=A0A931MGT6_9BURK|nr:DUF883 family protein [Caenimonas aquaedulcis]MBG9388129.1 DUF883 family protein [Caenimonas aquaedulcis]
MNTNTNNRNLRAAASGYADDALDSGRQFASHALESASDKARDLRDSMKGFASRGASTMSDAAAAAQRQLGHYTQSTTRYVSEQPVKSALIAAAIGAGVAALLLALRRNADRRRDY